MREISVDNITSAVARLCMEANYYLGDDIARALQEAGQKEESELGRQIMKHLLENAQIAKDEDMPICQDTGMAVIFVEIGQDVHVSGGSLTDAINEGVRQGYKQGYLRNSVVADPINRVNTGDNTPAIINYEIVPGDKVHIIVAPKGFGSENMSALKMLKPSDGLDGIKKFIIDTVDKAGSNPCPPMILGVGIGGTMEKAALLAKKALLRPINIENEDFGWAALEKEMLEEINKLGIGPQGLGGRTTAIGVNILTYPTHIAGLPVAVNISCHATRHAETTL